MGLSFWFMRDVYRVSSLLHRTPFVRGSCQILENNKNLQGGLATTWKKSLVQKLPSIHCDYKTRRLQNSKTMRLKSEEMCLCFGGKASNQTLVAGRRMPRKGGAAAICPPVGRATQRGEGPSTQLVPRGAVVIHGQYALRAIH